MRCWRRPGNAGASKQIGDARRSTLAVDQQARFALRQNGVDAFPRPARVNGHIDGSGQQGGEEGNDGIGALGQSQGDAVARLNSVFAKEQGQRLCLREEFGEGCLPLLFDQSNGVRPGRRALAQPLVQQIAVGLGVRLGQASPPR